MSYLHPFGCKCFILNTKDNFGKFDSRSDSGIFLGYSETSKAFRFYNSRTLVVEEAIYVRFGENKPDKDLSELDESFADLSLDDDSIKTISSRQNPEIKASTQQEVQEE